jgi:hypothetical protein
MKGYLRVFVTTLSLACALVLLGAAPVSASISGGNCVATGYASTSGGTAKQIFQRVMKGAPGISAVDLTSLDLWRVRQGDTLLVLAGASPGQPQVQIQPQLFGIALPISWGQAAGQEWVDGPWTVSPVMRRFGVTASTTNCSAEVVVQTSANPLLTVVGIVSLILLLGGLLLLGWAAGRPGSVGPTTRERAVRWITLLGGGLAAGIGEGLWLQQAGPLSPADSRSLLLPLLGLLVGAGFGAWGELRGRLATRRPARARSAKRNAPAPSEPNRALPGMAVGGALTVFLALGGLLPVGPSLTDQVVNAGQARQIATSAWSAAEEAYVDGDATSLSRYFSDQALTFVNDQLVGRSAGATGVDDLGRNLLVTKVYVPHQVSYPADFMVSGVVNTSSGSSVAGERIYLLFQRPNAGSPWTATLLDDSPVPAARPDVALSDQGQVTQVGSGRTRSLLMAPDTAAADYMQYLTAGSVSGAAPAGMPLVAGLYTSSSIAGTASQDSSDAQQGVKVRNSYINPQVRSTFSLQGGGAVALISFQWQESYSSTHGCFSAQGSSPFQPSGNLRRANITQDGVALLEIPAKKAASQIRVLAMDTGWKTMNSEPCQ